MPDVSLDWGRLHYEAAGTGDPVLLISGLNGLAVPCSCGGGFGRVPASWWPAMGGWDARVLDVVTAAVMPPTGPVQVSPPRLQDRP
ncbi:MAG: hypothetical protein ACRYHQ_05190, partial [Janthinobacterium lividum]